MTDNIVLAALFVWLGVAAAALTWSFLNVPPAPPTMLDACEMQVESVIAQGVITRDQRSDWVDGCVGYYVP